MTFGVQNSSTCSFVRLPQLGVFVVEHDERAATVAVQAILEAQTASQSGDIALQLDYYHGFY